MVDRDQGRAEKAARAFGVKRTERDVDVLLNEGAIDAAHVLVPPDLHRAVALPLLARGIHTLVEKPLADSAAAARELVEAADAGRAVLGVNQNFVLQPAFVRARKLLESGRYGRIRHVAFTYAMPLRQLASRQFGVWMFQKPINILLEQAVHPLSQLVTLIGPVHRVAGIAAPPLLLEHDLRFPDRWSLDLDGATCSAQLHLAFGHSFPAWGFTALCDDGAVTVDLLRDRITATGRSEHLETISDLRDGLRSGLGLVRDSARAMASYAAGTLKLVPRNDSFFVSMRASVRAFHASLPAGPAPFTGRFGLSLLEICEQIDALRPAASSRVAMPKPAPAVTDGPLVTVFGGTGFIGLPTVEKLRAAGFRVRVAARGAKQIDGVETVRADIADAASVTRAVAGSRYVINLAHGGGGDSYETVRAAMLDGALNVARAAREAGAERLIHVGTIASLYLGDPGDVITGDTPVDPQKETRALYARVKGETDLAVEAFARDNALALVLLRPGLVVGAGTSPFHSGVGFQNNEQHVIGWNAGRNPLPFVLVDDVADAIVASLRAPDAIGRAYNLVGDVRLSAREYIAELARALGRPIRFHPRSVTGLHAGEVGKWVIKLAARRPGNVFPPKRDLHSRGLMARFDISDAKRDLHWHPVADRAEFIRQAITPHANPFAREAIVPSPLEGDSSSTFPAARPLATTLSPKGEGAEAA
ncbi:hypothetical protein TMPK1_03610 [Rhodospirillales bacterium TMPK1]|uniref:NAD-dependent epimerase/dehydratase family protein n=1 Tax=Roseiterribacter gracilis TaxID=2812848 RepID=A0A8S8X770_9PROT|nr:hypothetical protein TMPK1_03610 [Rhodospirillales bacterium TMPK1]